LKTWLSVVLLGVSYGALAQNTGNDSLRKAKAPVVINDTLRTYDLNQLNTDTLITIKKAPYSPKRATFFALIIPGGGQIYNRDYWKLPLVYGGLGAAVYTIRWNTLRYRDFLEPYLTSVDPNTGSPTGKTQYEVYVRGKDEVRTLTLDQVKRGKTYYRRYREYGFVILAAVYALTAVEANVAAHLKTFDISEDLSLRMEPGLEKTLMDRSVPSIKLVFALK
jgi:hypothetical protein